MSNIPADLKYTKSHEWVRTLADGNVEIGITDHAQGALGDLVFVEVPEGGKSKSASPARVRSSATRHSAASPNSSTPSRTAQDGSRA